MSRIVVVLAAVNLVALAAVGFFVVHGSVRDGCALARTAAAQAWTAVALAESGDHRLKLVAAADAAAAFAAGDLLVAQALAGLPWGGGDAALGEGYRAQAALPSRTAQATAASQRALLVCR